MSRIRVDHQKYFRPLQPVTLNLEDMPGCERFYSAGKNTADRRDLKQRFGNRVSIENDRGTLVAFFDPRLSEMDLPAIEDLIARYQQKIDTRPRPVSMPAKVPS